MSAKRNITPCLLSDDPRDGSAERPDELGREAFAAYLGRLVDSVRSQSESSVMALIGDWGSGKTSILELLRKHLESSDPGTWLLADFNPWTYSDPPSLQTGFFSELTAALPRNGRNSGARTKVGELARSIAPIGKFGGLVGLDAEGALQAVADLMIGDVSASAAKRAAESALRRVHRPVLMVIDDLDRLMPEELLEVLKLVRLVGRLPHVYYLLAYDERTLLDVLRGTTVGAGEEGRARAYLEKIVQVRLDMPAFRASQRSRLLNEALKSILSETQLLLTAADDQRLSDSYLAVLDRRLTTPRAITRFLGQVQAFFGPLRGEVDFVDFFLISWLRTQEPGVYAMLQRERDALIGRSLADWDSGSRDAAGAEKKRIFWEEQLVAAQVDAAHREGVRLVLSGLFPQFQSAFAKDYPFANLGERITPKAISNPDYFDRYFTFGVPDDDLPDLIVSLALDDLANGAMSTSLSRFKDELRHNTALAIRKIDALRESGTRLPEVALFQVIARTAAELSGEPKEIFDDPRGAAERGAALCLIGLDMETAVEAARRVAEQPEGAEFVVNVVRSLVRNRRSAYASYVPRDYDLAPLVALAIGALRRRRIPSPTASPLEDGAMGDFWVWEDLDSSGAHTWLREQVDSQAWTLRDTVGALTSIATFYGAPDGRTGIGTFQVETVDQVFGLERVFRDLASELEAATPPSRDPLDLPATPENRIQYALFALQRARCERLPGRTQSGEPTAGLDT